MSSDKQPVTKKFQGGERIIPHPSQKASRYYPAEDEPQPKKARKSLRPFKPRASLQPGSVLILLAGRFRGKRVVLLKVLDQGVLLVTGPFKVNGVPLRRVNSRYVIATKTTVDMSALDQATIDKVGGEAYFQRDRKADKKGSEEAFFAQGGEAKPQKKKVSGERAQDQKKIDQALLKALKSDPMLQPYLAAKFSLRKGDRPHDMVF